MILPLSLNTTFEISKIIPNDRIIVSESGIKNPQDINKLIGIADSVLIGTSFMKANSIKTKAEELFNKKIIKICGITKEKDAVFLNNLKIPWLGFIFYPKSPRYIQPNQLKKWINKTDIDYSKKIGVFVNFDIGELINIAKDLNLFAVQLHGTEDESYIDRIKNALPKLRIIKAYSLQNSQIPNFYDSADYHLLDNSSKDKRGGTGESFDWSILDRIDNNTKKKIILAGGISKDNINKAYELPIMGIDLNSKVEIEPGIKNLELIKEMNL